MRLRSYLAALSVGGLLLTGTATLASAREVAAPSGAATSAGSPAHAGHGAGQASAGSDSASGLDALRRATDRFHSIAVAEQRGYALLTDAKKIACIDMPGEGGMGVHWANGTLVGDGAIDALHPEAVVYAPKDDGTLRLAAVEYVVLKAAWDAKHRTAPVLFEHTFDLTPAPNRYGLPAFYSLHVWVWKHNPAGTFTMWNPKVTCPPV